MSSSIMFYPLSSKLSNIISLVCKLYLCTMYIVHMWPSLIRLIHYFFIKALKKLLSAHLIVFIFAIGLSFIIYKQAFNVWSGKIHLNRFTFGRELGHTSEQPGESIHPEWKDHFWRRYKINQLQNENYYTNLHRAVINFSSKQE